MSELQQTVAFQILYLRMILIYLYPMETHSGVGHRPIPDREIGGCELSQKHGVNEYWT